MATINVLIAVDGAAIASQVADGSLSAGSQASPTYLGAYGSSNVYISMIAPNTYVSNGTPGQGQGQSELQVSANGGDTVEWAITTFDNNFDQTPFLYNGTLTHQVLSTLHYHMLADKHMLIWPQATHLPAPQQNMLTRLALFQAQFNR
jgi:hypothetical protein